VKLALGSMWLKNPVSGFWYNLRAEKDRFSTLNQGTGVYCFDLWLAHCRALGVKISAQFHDEQLAPVVDVIGEEDETEKKLKLAIKRVNDKLNLNVPLDVDLKFGMTYAEVH